MFYPQSMMQYGGAIRVTNEQEARNYPVAPGNSVLFIDASQPFVYAKTMSLTPYEAPRFEKFRLVREEDSANQPPANAGNAPTGASAGAQARESGEAVQFVSRKDFDALRVKIDAIEDFISKNGKQGE